VELGITGWLQETRIDGITRMRKKFDDIFNCLDTIHECDRHWPTASTVLAHDVAQ